MQTAFHTCHKNDVTVKLPITIMLIPILVLKKTIIIIEPGFLAFFQEFFQEAQKFCCAKFSCYVNFSIASDKILGGGGAKNLCEGTASVVAPLAPCGIKPGIHVTVMQLKNSEIQTSSGSTEKINCNLIK